MAAFSIDAFNGELPSVVPARLPISNAQYSQNIIPVAGGGAPLTATALAVQQTVYGFSINTITPVYTPDGALDFLRPWESAYVRLIQKPIINDAHDRMYFTYDHSTGSKARVATRTQLQDPIQFGYPLGVPAPDATASVAGMSLANLLPDRFIPYQVGSAQRLFYALDIHRPHSAETLGMGIVNSNNPILKEDELLYVLDYAFYNADTNSLVEGYQLIQSNTKVSSPINFPTWVTGTFDRIEVGSVVASCDGRACITKAYVFSKNNPTGGVYVDYPYGMRHPDTNDYILIKPRWFLRSPVSLDNAAQLSVGDAVQVRDEFKFISGYTIADTYKSNALVSHETIAQSTDSIIVANSLVSSNADHPERFSRACNAAISSIGSALSSSSNVTIEAVFFTGTVSANAFDGGTYSSIEMAKRNFSYSNGSWFSMSSQGGAHLPHDITRSRDMAAEFSDFSAYVTQKRAEGYTKPIMCTLALSELSFTDVLPSLAPVVQGKSGLFTLLFSHQMYGVVPRSVDVSGNVTLGYGQSTLDWGHDIQVTYIPSTKLINASYRVYAYSYQTAFGEESALQLINSEAVEVLPDSDVTLTLPALTTQQQADEAYANITHVNIYRSAPSESGEVFRFVKQVPSWYIQVIDNVPDISLGDEAINLTWDMPPTNMHSLTYHPAGFLMGASGRTLCASEMTLLHAWPVDYRYELAATIVTMVTVENYVVVLTDEYPYIVSGESPASLNIIPLISVTPCIWPRSVVVIGNQALYLSPQGIVSVSNAGVTVQSKEVLSIHEFQRFFALDTMDMAQLASLPMEATNYNGRYLFFLKDSTVSYVYNPANVAEGIFRFVTGATTRGFFFDREKHKTAVYTAGVQIAVMYLDTGSPLDWAWQSKSFEQTELNHFSCMRVIADTYPVTVTFLRDADFFSEGNITESLFSVDVNSKQPVRLPAISMNDVSFLVEGTGRLAVITLSDSMKEV